MSLLPYSLACIASALLFFYLAWTHRDMHLQQTWMRGIGSLLFLVGTALVTPWLWQIPEQLLETGYVWGMMIFPGVTIALLGSLLGVINAIRMIQLTYSDRKTSSTP